MPTTPDRDPTKHDPADHDGLLDRLDDFKHRIEEAAIEAEFETGEREETVEEAKAHALVRVARMTLGFVVVIVGIAALPLPGPGWLIIAGGLTILSKDVAWAERLLRYIRKRVPGIPEDGKIPSSSMATMAVVTLAAVAASLWWTFSRGSDEIQAGTYDVVELADPVLSTPITDPGIEIEITNDGPVRFRVDGCDDLALEVVERSKTSFTLGLPVDLDWSCDNETADRLVGQAAANELQLEHSTDGLVEWFLADNSLTSMSVNGEPGAFDLTVEPT